MLLALWLTLTGAAPSDALDGGTSATFNLSAALAGFQSPTAQSLSDEVTLPTQRFTLNRPLKQWLATNRPDPTDVDDGEGGPDILKLGGYTVFQDGDRAGLVDDATRVISTWTSGPIESPLVLITLPGPRAGLLLCTDVDCGDDGYACAKALLLEHARRCTWVAPLCPGVPAVDLSRRFDRLSVERDVITAEVFNQARPTCVPGDGPTPRWNTEPARLGSWGPSTLLRGTLEAHACAPPTWKRTIGHFSLYEDGDENDPVDPVYGRLMPLAPPRCR
jgi:hypothetical protein